MRLTGFYYPRIKHFRQKPSLTICPCRDRERERQRDREAKKRKIERENTKHTDYGL